jgi:hypothetical protein
MCAKRFLPLSECAPPLTLIIRTDQNTEQNSNSATVKIDCMLYRYEEQTKYAGDTFTIPELGLSR